MTVHRCHRASFTCLLVGMGVFASGCTGDGIVRHQVSGKVTFQGQPVNDGAIILEPDASIGKIAPTSFARIENGSFRTTRAEGPTTGKYKLRIMGYDKSKMKKDAAVGEIVDLPELFPEYAIDIDVPVKGGHLDIEVPTRRKNK
jgi:hypothetical protein